MKNYYDVYFKDAYGQEDVTTVLASSQDEAAKIAEEKGITREQIQKIKID